MAILLVNVKLREGVDQNSFVSEFDSVSEVTVRNLLPNIPNLVVFDVDDSYLSTLQSHPSVDIAEEEVESFPTVTYPSLPPVYTLSNKTISSNDIIGINNSKDGTDYISYQHYLDTDIIQKVGTNRLGNAFNDYHQIGLESYTFTHNAPILFTQALNDPTGAGNQASWLQDYVNTLKSIPGNSEVSIETIPGPTNTALSHSAFTIDSTLQGAIRNAVGSSNPSGTINNAQLTILPTDGYTHTVDGTSYPVMGKVYVPVGLPASSIDALVVFHGTVGAGVSLQQASETALTQFINSSGLNIRDKIIFSAAYPQDHVHSSYQYNLSGIGSNTFNFIMGDNLPYARAAVGWVKSGGLNSYIAAQGGSKTVNNVYLFGHSQGGKLVAKMNTIETGIAGVISNAPGPIQFDQTCIADADNYSCSKLTYIHGTSSNSRTNFDELNSYPGQTYSSRYTGKHVDIVTLEGGSAPTGTTYLGFQDTHPDFDDPDNTGTTRCVPMDWNGCTASYNNQVTSNNMFDAHAIGTLSVAGGVHSGFAKKANLYAIYTAEGLATVCNAVIHFHNNKSVNSATGLRNPTIVVGEFQYLRDTYHGVKITDISSVTDPTGGTTNRPTGGWGSDFTPFTSRNIFPYQVQDPDDSSWHWMVTFPDQSQSSVVKTAIDSLYDNGIIFINAAGNNGGTYVKESDSRWSGTYCTTDSNFKRYGITYNNGVASPATVTDSGNWFPFRAYGPHGLDKGIDVAAGQNSETHGMLDAYSNRGPGIDIVGRGAHTFSAYPSDADSNGKQWGDFSGTSCATPSVVGKAACMMEEYYTLNGAWPNFAQVKNMLQTQARNGNNRVLDPSTTTWSNVPAASTNRIQIENQQDYPTADALVRIKSTGTNGNGGFQFAELAGTPKFFAFLNTTEHSREQTRNRRPTSGVMYPRPRNVSDVE